MNYPTNWSNSPTKTRKKQPRTKPEKISFPPCEPQSESKYSVQVNDTRPRGDFRVNTKNNFRKWWSEESGSAIAVLKNNFRKEKQPSPFRTRNRCYGWLVKSDSKKIKEKRSWQKAQKI